MDCTAEDVEGGVSESDKDDRRVDGHESEEIIFAAHPSWDKNIAIMSGLNPNHPRQKEVVNYGQCRKVPPCQRKGSSTN